MRNYKLHAVLGILVGLGFAGIAKAEAGRTLTDNEILQFFSQQKDGIAIAFDKFTPTASTPRSEAAMDIQNLRELFGMLVADSPSLSRSLSSRNVRLNTESLPQIVKAAQAFQRNAGDSISQKAWTVPNMAASNGSVARLGQNLSGPLAQANYFDGIAGQQDTQDGTANAPAPAPTGGQDTSNAPAPAPASGHHHDSTFVEHYRIIYARSVPRSADAGNLFAIRVPGPDLKLPIKHSYYQFYVPGVSKVRNGWGKQTIQSQFVGSNGYGTNEYLNTVDEVPGWRGFPILGAGLEKAFNKFFVFAQTDIGLSKNTERERIEQQLVQSDIYGGTSVLQNQVLAEGPGYSSLDFYSAALGGVGYNVRPWFSPFVSFTHILTGGPNDNTVMLTAAPGGYVEHAAKNSVQVGFSFNIEKIRNH